MVKPIMLLPEKLGNFNSLIYLISENRIVKIPIDDSKSTLDKFKKEYSIQQKIYSRGYPVPRPYGIFPVEAYYQGSSIVKWDTLGLPMERISGGNLEYLSERGVLSKDEFLRFMDEARAIARDIEKDTGCRPREGYEIYPDNVIKDEKNNRIVLVDFGDWIMR